MKKLIITIVLVLVSILSYSQEYKTDDNGQIIIENKKEEVQQIKYPKGHQLNPIVVDSKEDMKSTGKVVTYEYKGKLYDNVEDYNSTTNSFGNKFRRSMYGTRSSEEGIKSLNRTIRRGRSATAYGRRGSRK
jgi:hypothetical protein